MVTIRNLFVSNPRTGREESRAREKGEGEAMIRGREQPLKEERYRFERLSMRLPRKKSEEK